jgi:hypothetical protein
MYRALFAGLVVGGLVALIFAREKTRKRGAVANRREQMTAEEKLIAHAHALIAERPETATPNRDFLRDWAYGNAGLEDEGITVEQVERVLNERSA